MDSARVLLSKAVGYMGGYDFYGKKECTKSHGGRGGLVHSHYSENSDVFLHKLNQWQNEPTLSSEREARQIVKNALCTMVAYHPIHISDDLMSQAARKFKNLDNVFTYKNKNDHENQFNNNSHFPEDVNVFFSNLNIDSFPKKTPSFNPFHHKKNSVSFYLEGNKLNKVPDLKGVENLDLSYNKNIIILGELECEVTELNLSHCDITTILPSFFNKSLEKNDKIILTDNPNLSRESLRLLKEWASEGHLKPEIIYDDGEHSGLSTLDLAREPARKIQDISNALEAERMLREATIQRAEVLAKAAKAEKEEKVHVFKKFGMKGSAEDVLNKLSVFSEPEQVKIKKTLESFIDFAKKDNIFNNRIERWLNEIVENNEKRLIAFSPAANDKNSKFTWNQIIANELNYRILKNEFNGRKNALMAELRNLFINENLERRVKGDIASQLTLEINLQKFLDMVPATNCHKNISSFRFQELIRLKEDLLKNIESEFPAWLSKHPLWQAEELTKNFRNN